MSMEVERLDLIQRFREPHHAVAKMFAMDMTPGMIRQRTGYSNHRLTILWNDPSFQELIANYRKRIDEEWSSNVDMYLDLGMANMIRAESQIAEHLDKSEDTGELMSPGILNKISQDRADRFGYSKHAVIEHKHDFASLLDRAIARSGKANEVKQIEGSVVEVSIPPPAPRERVETRPAVEAPRSSRTFAEILRPVKRRKVA